MPTDGPEGYFTPDHYFLMAELKYNLAITNYDEMISFDLTEKERVELFETLIPELEKYYSNTAALKVCSEFDPAEIRNAVRKADFNNPVSIKDAVSMVIGALSEYSVHTPHPKYYGLFNPRANFPSIIADLISATYNPQLAAWGHSPWAAE